MKDWLKKNWQLLFNIYLFLNLIGYVGWEAWQKWDVGNMHYVDISFTVQSVIMCIFVLIRMPHKAVEKSLPSQLVALAAFYSFALIVGQPATTNPVLLNIARPIMILANLFGIVCLLNLGRSFGILIAFRKVKSNGLYGVVRHPMYGTDILLRLGFLISHFSLFTFLVVIGSCGLYVWRALLEEQFLGQQAEYQDYKKRVRYRFIPWVF